MRSAWICPEICLVLWLYTCTLDRITLDEKCRRLKTVIDEWFISFRNSTLLTIGSFQKKYSIGSFELLSKTAPIQAVSLLLFGPIIDYYLSGRSLLKYHFATGAISFILLSCSLAVFCNMSQYLCIGRFSATTFQVLGHMKTVCVLILGWILFDSALTFKNILGMLLAVVGMVVYSWAVESDKKQASIRTESKLVNEEDVKLLKERASGAAQPDIEIAQTKS